MTTRGAAVAARPVRRHGFTGVFVGPIGYLCLTAIVAVLLVIGGQARGTTPEARRVAHLESIIRCPSCADLSIANSESPSAQGLRAEVRQLVHQGLSDSAIEARIESQFPGTLLIPSGDSGIVVFVVPAAVIVAGALTFAALLFRRTRTAVADDGADEALVEVARRARARET